VPQTGRIRSPFCDVAVWAISRFKSTPYSYLLNVSVARHEALEDMLGLVDRLILKV